MGADSAAIVLKTMKWEISPGKPSDLYVRIRPCHHFMVRAATSGCSVNPGEPWVSGAGNWPTVSENLAALETPRCLGSGKPRDNKGMWCPKGSLLGGRHTGTIHWEMDGEERCSAADNRTCSGWGTQGITVSASCQQWLMLYMARDSGWATTDRWANTEQGRPDSSAEFPCLTGPTPWYQITLLKVLTRVTRTSSSWLQNTSREVLFLSIPALPSPMTHPPDP